MHMYMYGDKGDSFNWRGVIFHLEGIDCNTSSS